MTTAQPPAGAGSGDMAPEDLLDAALFLVESDDPGTAGLWPRASALLGRQALEAGLQRFWAARAPGVERSPMRTQLLCLAEYLGDHDLAERLSVAWWALTRACHHHAYELAPTGEELTATLEVVQQALEVRAGGEER